MADGHAPRRLFQREVAEVREQERQLLPMVGAAGRLPWVLYQHDAEIPRLLPGQRPDSVGELVIGNEEPTTPGRIGLPLGQRPAKATHGSRLTGLPCRRR